MYTVAVSDHVMIAHSFQGELFGPAQGLHGATYAVEAEFRRVDLDRDGVVCDIGRAIEVLKAVLAPLAYRNLDTLEDFKGRNTTTEFLAGWIFGQLAAKAAEGALGAGTAGALHSIRVVLRESPVAWAAFEGTL
ncbi:MAG TPA: 6-carboxytetrahydropterin synthase [Aliidongia sp.]|nr:6-carboxytetrahydropterin synthase [Aliidongia sp.]